MNIFDLARTLPSGFHDAVVSKLSIDYVARTLTLELELWIGNADSTSQEERDERRLARLRIEGLQYCVIEPPDARYAYAAPEPLMIDMHEPTESWVAKLTPGLPPESFTCRMFVAEWNSFIHVAATDARVEWLDEPDG